jgi:hypothetical protein
MLNLIPLLVQFLTAYQLASNFVDSFDKLLDACKRIGDNLPRFIRFASIFQYSDRIQNIIGILYEDILEFYCRTLKFFRRRGETEPINLALALFICPTGIKAGECGRDWFK